MSANTVSKKGRKQEKDDQKDELKVGNPRQEEQHHRFEIKERPKQEKRT